MASFPPNLAENLRKLREADGRSQIQLALDAGLNRGAARDIESNTQKHGPRVDTVYALAKALRVPMMDLMGLPRTAPGPAEQTPMASAPAEELPIPDYAVIRAANDDYAAIPRFDMNASAGPGDELSTDPIGIRHHILFRHDWLQQACAATIEDLFAVDVVGDSMVPTLNHGDIALVDKTRTDPRFEGIYLVNFDGIIKVKRIRQQINKLLAISSDNPAYAPDTDISHNDVHILGRVFWIGRQL